MRRKRAFRIGHRLAHAPVFPVQEREQRLHPRPQAAFGKTALALQKEWDLRLGKDLLHRPRIRRRIAHDDADVAHMPALPAGIAQNFRCRKAHLLRPVGQGEQADVHRGVCLRMPGVGI